MSQWFQRHALGPMWCCILGLIAVHTPQALDLQSCDQRWRREEALSQLYLRLSQWDREGVEQTHHFYDMSTTFMLLARGASFARQPTREEEAEMEPTIKSRLLNAFARLGGFPERCGICVAALDTWSVGIQSHFRPGSFGHRSAGDPLVAKHVVEQLPPGKYCHALALEREHWENLYVSPLEIHEHLARDVLYGKRVLLLHGSLTQPSKLPAFRFAQSVAMAGVDLPAAVRVDELLADLAGLLSQVELVLLSLPPGVGALVAMEVTCRFGVQALDVGRLALTSLPGPRAPAPLTSRAPGGEEFPARAEVSASVPTGAKRRMELNGIWQVQVTSDTVSLQELSEDWQSIEVPFAPQSYRGLATKIAAVEAVWYRRELYLDESWCKAGVLQLYVDACDWECAFYLNSIPLGVHRGGYDPFNLSLPEICETRLWLTIRAWDPTDEGCAFTDTPPIPCHRCCETGWQPRGKQSLKPSSIMYTAVTGLWRQGLWIEELPSCYIHDLDVSVLTEKELKVQVVANCAEPISIEVYREAQATELIAHAAGPCCEMHLHLDQALDAWSPESPRLYELRASLGASALLGARGARSRRFARRSLEIREERVLLNGEAVFMHGVLYQGYWPESLLTPPDASAVERDLRAIKACGFNTVRVHAVVMSTTFYSLCDELGLMVWQDMPAGDMRAMPLWSDGRAIAEEWADPAWSLDEIVRSEPSQSAFWQELQAMIKYLKPYPSIVSWVLFNEGWGQAETQATVDWVRQLDSTRLVDAVSGWNEVGSALGDFADIHNYEDNSSAFGALPESFVNYAAWGYNISGRVPVLGEYGGLGYAVEGHRWSQHHEWGYGEKEVNRNPEVFADGLERLMGRLLRAICAGGVAGAIYTQWTDVETEVNGLLTYDRQFKLPLEFYQEFSSRVLSIARKCWAVVQSTAEPESKRVSLQEPGQPGMRFFLFLTLPGPERDTKEKVWMALEKATKDGQPMCANCQGKKKPPPPDGGFFAKLFGFASSPSSSSAEVVESDSDYEEDQVDEETGLVGAHCYTLLAAVEAAADGGTSWFRKERWIRLRNPWGTGRWKGGPQKTRLPFSGAFFDCGILDKEARRASKSAPAQVNEKQEGPEGEMLEEDLGTFWMRFSNFCEAFSTVQVSEYRPGYVSTLCHLKPTASQVAVSVDLPLDDQKEMEAVISVIQESDEAFTRNQRKKYSAVRLELFELTSPGGSPSSWTRGARHVASSSFATQRETVLRVAMKTGTNYLVVVHWLQAQPPQSWNSDATFRVYAPRPVSLEDAAVRGFADLAQREAYEAAAFGPRGVCLKEQGGVQLRCWSDRDSGTIALVFDATVAPAGLMASIHWRLQNANLQPSFPDEGSLKAKGVQEHVQQVELKPGQSHLRYMKLFGNKLGMKLEGDTAGMKLYWTPLSKCGGRLACLRGICLFMCLPAVPHLEERRLVTSRLVLHHATNCTGWYQHPPHLYLPRLRAVSSSIQFMCVHLFSSLAISAHVVSCKVTDVDSRSTGSSGSRARLSPTRHSGQLTLVSWLDPATAFSASYSWQAATDPCREPSKAERSNEPLMSSMTFCYFLTMTR
ncbi:unnamed protein product [Durusdinium trenchii]|uniref:Calpain catalytic domain-containing protein n=1 Tax=Durusdinium trenchii TaxID=1381693 RepID=A0ABP0SWX2_9DINO